MKLYGGPGHGMEVPRFKIRREVCVCPEVHRGRWTPVTEPIVYRPQETRTYYCERYAERRANPRRVAIS